jgi:GT2 family glycosyltransferase
MPNPLFSVVIPVFNRWELTADCLASLAGRTENLPYQVVVVDNGSDDETAASLAPLGERLFGGAFSRIRFEDNRNFAAGCNAGAEASKAPLLFFLNNDTLLTPGWAPPLLDALHKDATLGAVGPLLLYPHTRRIQHMGVAYALSRLKHLYAQFPASHRVVGTPRTLQAVTAAALLMPAELFRSCGGFHPGYHNGFEDLELCCRIRQQGKTLACVPQSRVYHLESQSAGRTRYDLSNSRLFSQRCGDAFFPDLHLHAALDGFAVSLAPDLTMILTLHPEATRQLAPLLAKPEQALETLLAEPLWQEAYEPAIRFLNAEKRDQEALDLQLLRVEFFPFPETYLRLAQSATRAQRPQLAEQAAGIMNALIRRGSETAKLAGQVRSLRVRGEKRQDEALLKLLAGWEAQYARN